MTLNTQSGTQANIQANTPPATQANIADTALKFAARFWFAVAVVGQMIFVYYIIAYYGTSTLQGDFDKWNKVLPHGYIPGDVLGNIAVGLHILMAAIITLGGPLQLIPQIRNRFPTFHHWNGRVFMVTSFIACITGLYMVWWRQDGTLLKHLGISFNAVFVILFGVLALRYAIAREIPTHRRWALRLFLTVNGVWFFRVGLMLWIFINKGPVGFDPKTFTGPFLTFLGFAQYLIPLAVLELYFRTQAHAGPIGRLAMAITLVILTVAMGVGIFVASMNMWLPRI